MSQESADKILHAAIEMIEAGGEAAVRVNELAHNAGLAVTAVYHYFGDRDGLIAAAQATRYIRSARDFMTSHATAVRACQSRDELRMYLHTFLEEVFSPSRADARWSRVNVLGSAYARPALQRAISEEQNSMFADTEQLWSEVKDKGFIRRDVDPAVIGPWYLSVITGRVIIEIPGTEVNSDAWNNLMYSILDHYFFGQD